MAKITTRESWLDVVKILSCVGVVYLHLSEAYFARADYFASGVSWYVLFVLRILASVSVPLFIMASGYLTIGKNYTPRQLWRRVAVRFGVPLLFMWLLNWILLAVSSIVLYLTPLRVPFPQFSQYLLGLSLAPAGTHFLVTMIGLNLLLPVWTKLFEHDHDYRLAKYVILLSLLVSIVITAEQKFNPLVGGEILGGWRWLLWVGYFLLGYLLRLQPDFITKKSASWLVGGGLALSTIINFFARAQTFVHVNFWIEHIFDYSLDYFAPWVMATSIGLFVLAKRGHYHWLTRSVLLQKCCSLLASLTLGIYIWHASVYGYLDVIWRHGIDNLVFWRRPVFALVGATLVTLIASGVLTIVCGCVRCGRLLVGFEDYWVYLPAWLKKDVRQLAFYRRQAKHELKKTAS